MTPFNRIAHAISGAKGFNREPNPRPLSDAEVVRIRLARWLRQSHSAGFTIPDLIARLHAEPPDSDWCPGYGDADPKRDRS